MEVDWVSGACMIARKEAVDTVGPLDERFFMYWEDADRCRRMGQQGWKVVYCPQVTVFHYVGKSSAKRALRSAVEFHRSTFRFFDKYARGYQKIVEPLVLCGLAMRLTFLIFRHFIKQFFQPVSARLTHKQPLR